MEAVKEEETTCKLIHQRVVLNIDLVDKHVRGITELSFSVNSLFPTSKLYLNARQMTIASVFIGGDIPAVFQYNYPQKSTSETQFDVELMNSELIIEFPPQAGNFVLRIEYYLAEPSTSVRFYKDNQFYALPLPKLGISRYWLPCIDRWDAYCQWDFEYNISSPQASSFRIISSGMLISEYLNEEASRKTSHYKLEIPTPASNVGMIAGIFASARIASAHYALAFCPTNRLPHLESLMEFASRAFGFYNWFLAQGSSVTISFPYPSMYFVFARGLPQSFTCLANLAVLSTELLLDQSIIDQVWETRVAFCTALCHQYFWQKTLLSDIWIPLGIRNMLVLQHLRVFHGNNDYKLNLRRCIDRVLERENESLRSQHYSLYNPNRTMLDLIGDYNYLSDKSCLVMVLLEQRLGKANMHRLVYQMYSELNSSTAEGSNPLHTVYFFKTAKRLTGKDLRSFIEQWVYASDCLPRYNVSFVYNRAKSIVELNFTEELTRRIHGSVLIRIHEVEGTYDHLVHLDEPHHHFELPYHTRTRKQRVPKVKAERTMIDSIDPPPLRAAETAAAETESIIAPLSWIRIDPEGDWLARFNIQQTDTMWVEQLENDRDVIAQWEAVKALEKFSSLSEPALFAIERIVLDVKIFYRIRCEAALALSAAKPTPLPSIRKLLEIYTKKHAHRDLTTNEVIPRANNFSESLPNYFVQCALLESIGSVRDQESKPMEPIVRFFTDFLRHNDNTLNVYSDCYLIAEMLKQLCINLAEGRKHISPNLAEDASGQIERYARVDRILPSHRNILIQTIVQHYDRFQFFSDFYLNQENHWEVRLACYKTEFELLPHDNPQLYYRCLERKVNSIESVVGLEGIDAADLYAEGIVKGRIFQLARPPELVERGVVTQAMETEELHKHRPLMIVETDWLSEMTGERTPLALAEPVNVQQPQFTETKKVPKLRLHSSSLNEDWKAKAEEALDAIWASFESYPFRYPVDHAVPGYYTLIKHPMDLSTIRKRLKETREYSGFADLLGDLRLLFDNCATFNMPGSLIVEQANRLKKFSIKELKAKFPNQIKLIKQSLKGSIINGNNNNNSNGVDSIPPSSAAVHTGTHDSRESLKAKSVRC